MTSLTHIPLDQLDLNEQARPSMPALPAAGDVERRKGRRLAAIHRHHLSEVTQIAAVLERIKAGDEAPENLARIVLDSDMRRNFEAAGTLCGHSCRVLSMHHDIEEHALFPVLAGQGNDALSKVVDKLRDEHLVIHELLTRLGQAAQALGETPDEAHFDRAYQVFFKLREAVLSHFGYEERELEEAIGLFVEAF